MYIESNFVPFKCSAELRENFPIFGIPHTIIINDKGEVIDRIAGYYPIDEFMEKLSYTVEGGENESAKREAKTYKDLKDAYEANPDDPEITWNYGKKLLSLNDYENSIPVFESLTNITLEDSTYNVWKFIYLGACYERVDRRSKPLEDNRIKSIERYNKAMDIGLTDIIAEAYTYSHLAELHFYGKEYDEVIKYASIIPDREKFENHENYRYVSDAPFKKIYLPFAYAFIGNQDKGREELEKLFKKVSEEKYSFSILNRFCDRCINYNLYLKEAVYWAGKAVELYDKYLVEEKKRVKRITDDNERKKAEENLKLTETESCYSVLNTHAQLASHNGDYETAINIWEKFPELPDSRGANYFRPRVKAYLAAVYIKSGQTEKGEKIFEEILNNWEDKRNAYFWVSLVCNEYKVKIKEAIEWTKEGIEKHGLGDVYWVTDAYAGLLFENGEIEKAIEWEEKAIAQMPEDKFLRNLEKFKAALK